MIHQEEGTSPGAEPKAAPSGNPQQRLLAKPGSGSLSGPSIDVSSEESAKWTGYFDRGFGPWDSGRPSSQLQEFVGGGGGGGGGGAVAGDGGGRGSSPHPLWVRLVADAAARGTPLTCLEPGCWFGNATRWLASGGDEHGSTYRGPPSPQGGVPDNNYPDHGVKIVAIGVDLVEGCVKEATRRAEAAGVPKGSATFLQADLLFLAAAGGDHRQGEEGRRTPLQEVCPVDFVYDCQCYHVLCKIDQDAAVRAYARMVRPGGVVLSLVGNANEPEVGPATLAREELVAAFTGGAGYFELADLHEGRFDMTEAYAKLPQPPLLWQAVFVRTSSVVVV